MKLHHFICFNISVLFTLVIQNLPSNGQISQQSKITFTCQSNIDNVPTIYVITEKGIKSMLRFKSHYFSSAGYTPIKRCVETSSRLQKLYNEGRLNYISTGYVDNIPAICGFAETDEMCSNKNLIFTLPPHTNPEEFIIKVFRDNNLNKIPSDDDFKVVLHGDPTTPPPPPIKPFFASL